MSDDTSSPVQNDLLGDASIARNAILHYDSPPEASPSNGDADQPGAFLSDVDMKPQLPFDKQLERYPSVGWRSKQVNNALQEELEGARDRVVAKFATTVADDKVQAPPIVPEDCPRSEWTIFAATALVDASLGGVFR